MLSPPAAPPRLPTAAPRSAAPTAIPNRFDEEGPTRSVRDALRKRDAAWGLDLPGAGRIASVLADLAPGETPKVSSAVFRARVTSDGEVLPLEVVSFRGATARAWRRVARRANQQLAGLKLHMPTHLQHGAAITVRIHQNAELPSGQTPPSEEDADLFVPPKRPRKSRREEPIATVEDVLWMGLQGLGNPETAMPPIGSRGTTTGTFDVSNWGATRQRVIHTSTNVHAIRRLRHTGPRRIRSHDRVGPHVNKRTPPSRR